jgi:hypothetical protein
LQRSRDGADPRAQRGGNDDRFGLVERQLKLARAAPAILEAFRHDEMSLD